MNKKEIMEIIDQGLLSKPKGYRVHFQEKVNDEWLSVLVPDQKDVFYDSDVVAWRIAWKLSQSVRMKDDTPDMVNIYVVNDAGERIPYYATGDYKTYHPVNGSSTINKKAE